MNYIIRKKYLIIVSLMLFVLIGCSNYEINNIQSQVDEFNQRLANKDAEIKALNEEIEIINMQYEEIKHCQIKYDTARENYSIFLEQLVRNTKDEELDNFYENFWVYSINYIDGEGPFTKFTFENDVVTIASDTFQFSISEKILMIEEYISNHYEQIEEASLDYPRGRYYEEINIITDYDYEQYGTDGTVVTGMVYKFKDVKDDFRLELELSDELAGRLGTQFKTITFVKE